jgi:hypothetical protein
MTYFYLNAKAAGKTCLETIKRKLISWMHSDGRECVSLHMTLDMFLESSPRRSLDGMIR